MKALELLNKLSVNLKNRSIAGRDYEVFWRGQIEEAIAELEALQQELKDANEAYLILLKQYHALNEPKSCETCKHWTHDVNGDIDPNMMFGKCMFLGIQGKFFYCASYEPKDSHD